MSCSIENACELLVSTADTNKNILICGNGGSAADAQHLAAELMVRYKKDRRPIKALSLVTDTSLLTACGNDFSFDEIFSRQVEALGNDGDLLIAFSTSGTSENIRKAIDMATSKQMNIIFMTGLNRYISSEHVITINITSKETARIQEAHQLIYHYWCEQIDSVL